MPKRTNIKPVSYQYLSKFIENEKEGTEIDGIMIKSHGLYNIVHIFLQDSLALFRVLIRRGSITCWGLPVYCIIKT